MKLLQLIQSTPFKRIITPHKEDIYQLDKLSSDLDITSVYYRAQDVKPGAIFIAVKGLNSDGHDFIDLALKNGALAIVAQKPVIGDAVTVIEVENSRKALASISSQFYDNPSEKMIMIGITGTNGKTTTSYIIENLLATAGLNVGVIGTINYHYNGQIFKNPVTTPESLDLMRILSEMRQKNITHVVMEVSSHAIDLLRVDSCWFDVCVFTNLTQDHLDYHKDMDSYWECKKSLFTNHLCSGPKKDKAYAVINCCNEKGKDLSDNIIASKTNITLFPAGASPYDKIRLCDSNFSLQGIKGTIATPTDTFEFKSPLVGKHNIENILCAVGVGVSLSIPVDSIKKGIESLNYVPGRLESITNSKNRFIYVDYAHTPDALENVLTALKKMTLGRIISVFGCGGDRDKGKRPQMGEIAARISDLAIVTSDNPRTENPEEIIDQILVGVRTVTENNYNETDLKNGFEKKGYVVEPDRRKAIELGVLASRPQDTILIAGKGHENYQIIGKKTFHFDDREEIEKVIEKL